MTHLSAGYRFCDEVLCPESHPLKLLLINTIRSVSVIMVLHYFASRELIRFIFFLLRYRISAPEYRLSAP